MLKVDQEGVWTIQWVVRLQGESGMCQGMEKHTESGAHYLSQLKHMPTEGRHLEYSQFRQKKERE